MKKKKNTCWIVWRKTCDKWWTWIIFRGKIQSTYDGINGAGSAGPPGRPCGNGGPPPPGRLGIAGAARAVAGGGGGPRDALPSEP